MRPRISSMPRQRNEATAYLDIYKLVVEKRRLREEMRKLDLRRLQIQQRLGELEVLIDSQEKDVQALRVKEAIDLPPQQPIAPQQPIVPRSTTTGKTFDTLFLEY